MFAKICFSCFKLGYNLYTVNLTLFGVQSVSFNKHTLCSDHFKHVLEQFHLSPKLPSAPGDTDQLSDAVVVPFKDVT